MTVDQAPAEHLLSRQWQGYSRYHESRRNLLIHIVAVPAFQVGNALVVLGAARSSAGLAAAGVGLSMAAMAAQGRGHRGENTPPEPFAGPKDALLRILAEQWLTFPRFVLSGGWSRALREG